jgi:hypothetical protein
MKVQLPEVLHTGQYKTWPEEREKFKFFLEEAKKVIELGGEYCLKCALSKMRILRIYCL